MTDLITLTELKAYLFPGETNTTYDSILPAIISAVSQRVRDAVGGCELLYKTYTAEEITGKGHRYLDTKHWPIKSVTTVTDQDSNTYVQGHDDDYTFDDYSIIAVATGVWLSTPPKYYKVTYAAGNMETGSITAVADYSGTVTGTVKATCANHGLSTGTTYNVAISGTTDYNGTFSVTYVDKDSFYFTETFASSQTGTWTWGGPTNDIRLLCFELCMEEFKAMKDKWAGESSRSFPDGSVSLLTDKVFTRKQQAIVDHHKRPRA